MSLRNTNRLLNEGWLLSVGWILLFICLGSLVILDGQRAAASETAVPQPDVHQPPAALTPPVETTSTAPPPAVHTLDAGATNFLFLPMIVNPPTCNLTAEETAVANLAMSHPLQGRSAMICDPILTQVARQRAIDMANRDYFSHVDPDGFGPNYHVEQAGYILPSWYGATPDANNIESIAAGYGTPDAVWSAWLGSGGHRAHVLAEISFWAEQTHYGIGHYYDAGSTYRHYWVFITAPPSPNS